MTDGAGSQDQVDTLKSCVKFIEFKLKKIYWTYEY